MKEATHAPGEYTEQMRQALRDEGSKVRRDSSVIQERCLISSKDSISVKLNVVSLLLLIGCQLLLQHKEVDLVHEGLDAPEDSIVTLRSAELIKGGNEAVIPEGFAVEEVSIELVCPLYIAFRLKNIDPVSQALSNDGFILMCHVMSSIILRREDFRSLQEALHYFDDVEALAEGVAVVHHVAEMIVFPVPSHVKNRVLRLDINTTLVSVANDLRDSNGNGACSCR